MSPSAAGGAPLVVHARVPHVENAGRAGVRRARAAARRCLAAAARELGLEPESAGSPGADRLGAPVLRAAGWHASLAHTPGLVAAALARAPVGIDAEWTGRRRLRAARESADALELERLGSTGDRALLRLWTAKEAVLKKLGAGLTALSRCRLVATPAGDELELECDGVRHAVVSYALGGHWLSVAGAARPVLVDATGAGLPAECVA